MRGERLDRRQVQLGTDLGAGGERLDSVGRKRGDGGVDCLSAQRDGESVTIEQTNELR